MRRSLVLVVCLLVVVVLAEQVTLERTLSYIIQYDLEDRMMTGLFFGALESVLALSSDDDLYVIGFMKKSGRSVYVHLVYSGKTPARNLKKLVLNEKTFYLAPLNERENRFNKRPYFVLWSISDPSEFIDEILNGSFDMVIVEIYDSRGNVEYLTIFKDDFNKFVNAFEMWAKRLLK